VTDRHSQTMSSMNEMSSICGLPDRGDSFKLFFLRLTRFLTVVASCTLLDLASGCCWCAGGGGKGEFG
jgi:hypothetical protein